MEITEAEIYDLIGRQAVRLHKQNATIAQLQAALAESRRQVESAAGADLLEEPPA